MPISMASAPVGGGGPDGVDPARVAAGDVRHEQLATGRLGRREARLDRSVGRPPSAEQLHRLGDVLVAAPGQVDEHGLAGERRRLADHPGDGVGRLEGGDDPLGAGEQGERVEHLGVG